MKGYQNLNIGSKSRVIFTEGVKFAYGRSCIGKGLR